MHIFPRWLFTICGLILVAAAFAACQLQGLDCIDSSDCTDGTVCSLGWCRSTSTKEGVRQTEASPEKTLEASQEQQTPEPLEGSENANLDAGPTEQTNPTEQAPSESTSPENQCAKAFPLPALGSVQTFGDDNNQLVKSMALASNGALFLTGAENSHIFVSKYTACKEQHWKLVGKGSTGGTVPGGEGIVVTTSNEIILTGNAKPTSTYGGFSIKNQGPQDTIAIVTAKLQSQSGNIDWLDVSGGALFDNVRHLAPGPNDSYYLTGQIRGRSIFGTLSAHKKGGIKQIFVAKMGKEGSFQWVTVFEGKAPQEDHPYNSGQGQSVAATPSGNLYAVGQYSHDFAFGSTTLQGGRQSNCFVTMLDSKGQTQWAQRVYAKSQDGKSNNSARCFNVATDSSGNAYVSGSFDGVLHAGTLSFTSRGGQDIFVLTYDKKGNPQRGFTIGGSGEDKGNDIEVDNQGALYLAANVGQQLWLDGKRVSSTLPNNSILVKLTPQGKVLWHRFVGGTESVAIQDLLLGPNQSLWFTGNFQGNLQWKGQSFPSQGKSDVFVGNIHRDNP